MTSAVEVALANRLPSPAEIDNEVLHLDAYGMTACNLAENHPIDMTRGLARQDLRDPLIDKMAEDGWCYAGAGFFSIVFVKGGLALKIGFKPTDTGSMYAAWCRANQGLPGVPTIYGITKFNRCYVVLTRRYEKLREVWLDDDDDDYLPELHEEYENLQNAVNLGWKGDDGRFDTVKTGIAIHEFFHGVVSFDLHEANIMVDHDGNLVITDPISYGACSKSIDSALEPEYSYYTDEEYV